MKIVIIIGFLAGTFTQNNEQCKKYICSDGMQEKGIYILSSEKWDFDDTIIVPDSVWNKAPRESIN